MRMQASALTIGRREVHSGGRVVGLAGLLASLGGGILRYGLVAILLYLGSFKFTRTEAEAIQPLLLHSPLLGWLYSVTSVQGAAMLIGTIEIAAALLIVLRPWAARLSALGSAITIGMFLSTLSFLLSTPGVWEQAPDFPLPVPGGAAGFLLKDLFLLGAAVWCTGEALGAAESGSH